MLSLQQFTSELCTRAVKVRGHEIRIRALSAAESDRIRSCLPAPVKAGDLNLEMLQHAAALERQWAHRVTRAELAVGLGWVTSTGLTPTGDGGITAAYCVMAAEEIAKAFTQHEINALVRAANEAEGGGPETGNSSSTPGRPAPSVETGSSSPRTTP